MRPFRCPKLLESQQQQQQQWLAPLAESKEASRLLCLSFILSSPPRAARRAEPSRVEPSVCLFFLADNNTERGAKNTHAKYPRRESGPPIRSPIELVRFSVCPCVCLVPPPPPPLGCSLSSLFSDLRRDYYLCLSCRCPLCAIGGFDGAGRGRKKLILQQHLFVRRRSLSIQPADKPTSEREPPMGARANYRAGFR